MLVSLPLTDRAQQFTLLIGGNSRPLGFFHLVEKWLLKGLRGPMELIACAILEPQSLKQWGVVYGTRTWFSFKDGAVKILS